MVGFVEPSSGGRLLQDEMVARVQRSSGIFLGAIVGSILGVQFGALIGAMSGALIGSFVCEGIPRMLRLGLGVQIMGFHVGAFVGALIGAFDGACEGEILGVYIGAYVGLVLNSVSNMVLGAWHAVMSVYRFTTGGIAGLCCGFKRKND